MNQNLIHLVHIGIEYSASLFFSEMADQGPKRRRIIVDEDEETEEQIYSRAQRDNEDSVGSNPDELLEDDRLPSDEEEGEDLQENWMA
jgi:hypothetical protein